MKIKNFDSNNSIFLSLHAKINFGFLCPTIFFSPDKKKKRVSPYPCATYHF